jgi:hypothetical protein
MQTIDATRDMIGLTWRSLCARQTGSSMTEAVRRTLTNRERRRLSDWRRKRGIHRRTVSLTDDQLDALEVRGYLDPDRRGDRPDETDAIAMFLMDSLLTST